jgi:ribonucleoside-triphosphate reductase
MIVIKRDNTEEQFQVEKIERVVRKAFESCGSKMDYSVIDCVISNYDIESDEYVSAKELQDRIEKCLMDVDKDAARAYIANHEQQDGQNKAMKRDNDFINEYIKASNASTGSKYDANANVEKKNVVTLGQEIHKGKNIRQNRYMMFNKIKSMYSKKLANQYIADLESHVLYKHDESGTPGYPYCVAITMYPFLVDGLRKIGGQSVAPTDLKSYCGEFINLVYSVSSQFMGAVATPEFLLYMDYFIRKDYGDDYLTILDKQVELNRKGRTLEQVIENSFQQVVHSMNMPAGNRGYQTVFWNCGYFDKNYFDGVFGDFTFPDGTKPIWETLSWLQKKFMKWFNQERSKYILTFPVETMAMLTDGHDVIDKEYADFTAEMWSEGHSFFCYLSDSPDSLSSCCRLRNSLKDVNQDDEHNQTTHQFSMGTASVATGSKSVMTINLNRLIQNATRNYLSEVEGRALPKHTQVDIHSVKDKLKLYEFITNELNEMTERVHKYQKSFNSIIKDFYNAHMLDIYTAGFIDMRKQYLTVGVNGLTDAAEFLGIEPNLNEEYEEFVNIILETINKSNRKDRTRDCMFNTEFVPGENLSNKNYKWDKMDGYYVSPKHIMYSSYFFNPEDTSLSIIDKMKLHGNKFVKYLDGGQAAHLNINEHLSFEQYRQLLRVAAENGCSYYTFNCKNTVCNDCGYISKDTLDVCPKCGSKNLDYLTRIIGYLKRVSSFAEPRQIEEKMRYYN